MLVSLFNVHCFISATSSAKPTVIANKSLQQISTLQKMNCSSSSSSLQKEEDVLFEFSNSNPPPAGTMKGHTRKLSSP